MKERPIIFSAPMVRAILEGQKTQTRRTVTSLRELGAVTEFGASDTPGYAYHCRDRRQSWNDLTAGEHLARCPYGQPGDRLWVRETFYCNHFDYPDGSREELKAELHYRADGTPDFEGEEAEMQWRPSIHMPRWASRLLLEIVNIRVERLQDISEADACAEGVGSPATRDLKRPKFAALWDQINGPRGDNWAVNPWVWVMDFKVVQP